MPARLTGCPRRAPRQTQGVAANHDSLAAPFWSPEMRQTMSTQTTTTSAAAWSPDVQGFVADDVIPEALVNRITTISGFVDGDEPAVRVPVVADDEATVVPEGQEIPEGNPNLSEAVVNTVKVAKLMRLSREQFYTNEAAGILSNAAQRSIVGKADDVILNHLTAPTGLMSQITADAGAVADDLDGLIDAVATIETAGGNPSHILLSPTAWASLQKFKASTGSAGNLLGAGTQATVAMVLGIPVVVNRSVPAGSGLIVDMSDIVSAVGPVNVSTSSDVYFTSDSIGLRVTFRFGATVVHADRHTKFTVTAPTP